MWNEVSGGQVPSVLNGVHRPANRHTQVVAKTCSSILMIGWQCIIV